MRQDSIVCQVDPSTNLFNVFDYSDCILESSGKSF